MEWNLSALQAENPWVSKGPIIRMGRYHLTRYGPAIGRRIGLICNAPRLNKEERTWCL